MGTTTDAPATTGAGATGTATTTAAERSEQFAARMMDVLNHGALALGVSIGHKTGLFDAMAGLPPATSERVAAAAGLHERYVREWLGIMTTGRVVDHDPAAGTFTLPPEHAAWLTRAAGPENLAIMAQVVGMLAGAEDRVVDCFRDGGGVPYSAYPDLTRIQAEDSAAVHDRALVDTIIPLVPGLPDRLRRGITAADVGCGSGHAVNLLARAFPASRFLGLDISEEGIAAARAEAGRLGLANARFEVQDAAALDAVEEFDLVTTFDSVHDQARPDLALAAIARALRPDGVYLCVDIRASSDLHENLDHPLGPFFYTASCLHCMTVSLAEGGLGLGTMWGEQLAQRMLAEAGFASVDLRHVDDDPFNAYYVASKGAGALPAQRSGEGAAPPRP